MNFFTKRRIKKALKNTDFQFAASVITEEFSGGVIHKELAALFDSY